jgi:RNA polymerase sigma-70 factor (ECF subfamily)
MAVRRAAARRPPEEASGQRLGDDRLLVEAAQKDSSRFAELYELNFARVYAYIARRVGDRDAAQDLTSDVFHKALASIQSFEWRGVPFAGWLLRIAANLIVDRSKRGAREITGLDDTPEPSTEVNLEEIDQSARLFHLVEQLPADQRRINSTRR